MVAAATKGGLISCWFAAGDDLRQGCHNVCNAGEDEDEAEWGKWKTQLSQAASEERVTDDAPQRRASSSGGGIDQLISTAERPSPGSAVPSLGSPSGGRAIPLRAAGRGRQHGSSSALHLMHCSLSPRSLTDVNEEGWLPS